MRVHFRIVFCTALVALVVGCGTTAPFVWVDAVTLPPASASGDYVIGVGDLLSVQVWEQDKMSTKARVRTDGKISIPFLYDVAVVNKTPSDVAHELEVALKPYMLVPKVNVVVDEPRAAHGVRHRAGGQARTVPGRSRSRGFSGAGGGRRPVRLRPQGPHFRHA